MKKWYSVQLNSEEAKTERRFLKKNNIKLETQGCGSLVHFEIYCTEEDAKIIDEYIDNIPYCQGRKPLFFMLKFHAGIIYQFTKISYLNIHAVFLNKNSSYINWYNIPKTLERAFSIFFSKLLIGILFHEFTNEILSYIYMDFYIKILSYIILLVFLEYYSCCFLKVEIYKNGILFLFL